MLVVLVVLVVLVILTAVVGRSTVLPNKKDTPVVCGAKRSVVNPISFGKIGNDVV